MDKKTIKFIEENESSDTARLLLSASKYPEVDMQMAVRCIEARKKLRSKVPEWYMEPSLEYPLPLSLEQCSSQATALYKQRFVPKGSKIADLTGGLGIDTYFLSKVSDEVDYFERDPSLSKAAKANFAALKTHNINVNNSNIEVSHIKDKGFKHYNLIYLDPARRNRAGKKIFSLSDCEPNILELKALLFRVTNLILVKISPMADITSTIRLLPETSHLHILSVDNECKEILLLMKKGFSGEPSIHAVNLSSEAATPYIQPEDATHQESAPYIQQGAATHQEAAAPHIQQKPPTQIPHHPNFTFSQEMERNAYCPIASPLDLSPGKKTGIYLFEPNKSLLKSGAFKLTGARFGLAKIAVNTHLYLGETPIPDFPGKCYKVLEILEFNKQTIRSLPTLYPQASVTARNFPLSSDQLSTRLGIQESDTTHIFATTIANEKKVLLVASRI